MVRISPKTWLSRFRSDERGSAVVEAVITLPILLWAVAATYEFFEVHRYNSTRDKASYTIADMISREMQSVTPAYMDSVKTVFDMITNDNGDDSVRVSVIKYDEEEDVYSVKWSQVRGPDTLKQLVTNDVKTAHARLPIMRDGDELIVVDSLSTYPSIFRVGMGDNLQVGTHVFTSPRFAPQINWEDS